MGSGLFLLKLIIHAHRISGSVTSHSLLLTFHHIILHIFPLFLTIESLLVSFVNNLGLLSLRLVEVRLSSWGLSCWQLLPAFSNINLAYNIRNVRLYISGDPLYATQGVTFTLNGVSSLIEFIQHVFLTVLLRYTWGLSFLGRAHLVLLEFLHHHLVFGFLLESLAFGFILANLV